MRSMLGRASRIINRMLGGAAGQSLCGRIAKAHGPDCGFCRLIAAILKEPAHCLEEMRDD